MIRGFHRGLRRFLPVLLAGGCTGSAPRVLPPHAGLERIVVVRDQVYDLSGYADEGHGNPFALFDENAFVDPRYPGDGTAYRPVSDCQPTFKPEIYFGPAGSRIVADLLVPRKLQEIWYYDRSRHADSFWIFTGNFQHWDTVAARTTSGWLKSGGWKKIVVQADARFVMIRFSRPRTAITEMVFYGAPLFPGGSAAPAAAGAPPDSPGVSAAEPTSPTAADRSPGYGAYTSKPLNQFLGVNYIIEDDARWLKPFHYSRLYNFSLDFDDDTLHQGRDVSFNMLHYGRYDAAKKKYSFLIDTLQRVNDGNLWFSLRGVSRWMTTRGFGEKDRPVDKPGLDPFLPESYGRHGRMMFNFAAFFGYTATDTNRMRLSHSPRQSGRGTMQLFENGNEEDAWWVGNKYADPVSVFAQSSADWDGAEGKLGSDVGIHNADPYAKLMMSGLIGLDTNRVKVYRLLCEQLRADRRFVWNGGIQFHHYSARNGHGISPEDDSLRTRLLAVRNAMRKAVPGVECFLGETGYDKNPQSLQGTPVLPGYSAAQSQGILLLRAINATFFSGFDACILYWLKDGDPPTDPRTYLTSGLLRNLGNGKTQAYPAWYYISGLVQTLGNYVPDSVLSEKGDVWIYRYRSPAHPDSVALFLYAPTVTGERIAGATVDVGGVRGAVTRISLSGDTGITIRETLTPVNGQVRADVGEKPIILLFRR